ncbi:MAG: hypothetical protein L0241_23465 [Planctomycetia bacterium]|nr:hypothetical protein [Planctomycetia bacterium]
MTLRPLALFLLSIGLLLMLANPVAAADSTPLFSSYWAEFLDHWADMFQKQNGIVMLALAVGVVCLFIITRGKWKK